jgi:hypothetical protein
LIGVGCLAVPVKFVAPGLKAGEALDVGRHTFAAFNKLEWLCAVVLLAICAGWRVLLLHPDICMQTGQRPVPPDRDWGCLPPCVCLDWTIVILQVQPLLAKISIESIFRVGEHDGDPLELTRPERSATF